jgi:exodeoxyribonuclease VII large subunit
MSNHPQEPLPDVLTVAEFNARIARLLERSVPLVWVSGEVGNFVKAASGHWYFSIKDDQAQVRCVMFRNANRLVDWRLSNGDQVEVRAVAGLYAPRGEFQLTVEAVRRAGAGALYEAFLRSKAKLEALGWFDAGKKRALPPHPRSIGVVTSLQAAALQDVLSTLKRRSAHLRVVIYPSPVQGRDSPRRLTEAVRRASLRAEQLGEIDVLLVVRGGGSLEDLAAFNDEALAEAIVRCSVPVISGVGHETDVTIADFVADVRAPTPTAAAELASPDAPRILALVEQQRQRARRALSRQIEIAEQRLDYAQRRLRSPLERLQQRLMRITELRVSMQRAQRLLLAERSSKVHNAGRHLRRSRLEVGPLMLQLSHRARQIRESFERRLVSQSSRLGLFEARLALLDPNAALERGYAIVQTSSGAVVDDAANLSLGQIVTMRFRRGSAAAEVQTTDLPEEM